MKRGTRRRWARLREGSADLGGPRIYSLEQLDDLGHDALVRTEDGAVITAAAARFGLETLAITEKLLAEFDNDPAA